MGKRLSKLNRGFTMVELIVVLMIVAIFAAMVSPAMISYIDRTHDKTIVANAEAAVTAAQAELKETYNSGKVVLTAKEKQKWNDKMDFASDVKFSVSTVATADTVKAGNERAAYTIARAWYVEDGTAIYFDGKTYEVRNFTGAQLPIVLVGEDLEDSTLMYR